MRLSEIGLLMGSLEGVALPAGLRAHNLLWRKCAQCVSDDSIDYESRQAVLLYTEWWRNVHPQHAHSPMRTNPLCPWLLSFYTYYPANCLVSYLLSSIVSYCHSLLGLCVRKCGTEVFAFKLRSGRSEEHTSELQ